MCVCVCMCARVPVNIKGGLTCEMQGCMADCRKDTEVEVYA